MTKTVFFDRLGGPEVLQLVDEELRDPAEGEVRIRVDAIGVNRAEALFRAGTYVYGANLPGSRLGYEAAGVVEAVGPGVEGHGVGDAVATMPAFLMTDYGTYGESAIVPAYALVGRPPQIDALTGAATWMSYTTAYGLLVEFGGLRAADHVVVTGASSSVGLAAIQIANQVGAIPIVTTRTEQKRQQLLDAGAAHVVVTEQQDVLAEVGRLTDGLGAPLVVDAVGGTGVTTLIQAVAPGGSLVVYGWLDPAPIPFPIAPDFVARNVRSYAFTEVTVDPVRRRRAEHFVNAGLRSGTLRPILDKTFEFTDVVAAHRHLESNTQFGKVMLAVAH